MSHDNQSLQVLYANRFDHEGAQRTALWRVLCSDFFQRWVPEDATVLDIAAGHCEFINNIRAARKLAVDLNPDVVHRAASDVRAFVTASDEMTDVGDASIDRVFIRRRCP